MARFDVCKNKDRRTSATVPYLLVLQHEFVDDLATRVVAPLFRAKSVPRPLTRLNPVVEVRGEALVVMLPELAGVPRTALGPVVDTLASERARLVAGLDFLLSGA